MSRKGTTKTVWITRDGKDGEEPDLIFIHGQKPELNEFDSWASGVSCFVIPDLKHGQRKRLRLEA